MDIDRNDTDHGNHNGTHCGTLDGTWNATCEADEHNANNMSTGTIIGISLATLVAAILIACALFYLFGRFYKEDDDECVLESAPESRATGRDEESDDIELNLPEMRDNGHGKEARDARG
jgi:hypothetical protein